ncbi:CBASS cGAMP-activated phospholipase [Desulfovibrio sp. TomC]|uniref:CBASS cGAMP-activated phospholipase n=1 Tax=Desulfovibrio sp. TomC TaxID=1562888 RepID=UPI0018CD9C6A|nr:CBASS cGAMP-activated phospholipase [Desulfovibrio sp. TomC]
MKILSIDGGGIKGLFSASFLAGVENRCERPIADYFDIISGTSTGGILALALAAKIPAIQIVNFYKHWGPKIFRKWIELPYILKQLFVSRYTNKVLINALKDIFGELTLGSIYNNSSGTALCIPSINVISGKAIVFKTQHEQRLTRDLDTPLWEVALATSAAPTYFPLAQVSVSNSDSYILCTDGGLWANNPTLVAFVEALSYLNAKIEDISILSLGNIKGNTCFRSNTYRGKGLFWWNTNLVSMFMDTQSEAVHNQIEIIFRSQGICDNYIRIDHDPTKAQTSLASLDCASKTNLNDLEVIGRGRADIFGLGSGFYKFFNDGEKNG